MKKTMIAFFATALLSLLPMISYANAELNAEVTRYLNAFKGHSFEEMKGVLGEMEWKGITDKRIYEAMLVQFNKTKLSTDKVALNQTAYFAHGLVLSGDIKYKKIIEAELAKSPPKYLARHYANALKEFDQYVQWNPVISANLEKAQNIHMQRVENMLKSNFLELNAVGAKYVYSMYYNDKKLVDLAAKRLSSIYAQANDKVSIEAGAQLCKAISKSGMIQYKELLNKVAETAENKKLRKYAAKYAKSML